MNECIHEGVFAPADCDLDGTTYCPTCRHDVPNVEL